MTHKHDEADAFKDFTGRALANLAGGSAGLATTFATGNPIAGAAIGVVTSALAESLVGVIWDTFHFPKLSKKDLVRLVETHGVKDTETLADMILEISGLVENDREPIEELAEALRDPAGVAKNKLLRDAMQRLFQQVNTNTDSISKLAELIEANKDDISKLSDKVDTISDSIQNIKSSTTNTSFQLEIDEAKTVINSGKINIGLDRLDTLLRKHERSLSRYEKSRIAGLRGHAYSQKGDTTKAAKYYMDAYDYDPDRPRATTLLAHAQFFIDRNSEEFSNAISDAVSTKPPDADAWTLWAITRSQDMPTQEIIDTIPDRVSDDLNVIYGIARAAFSRENYDVSEEYSRKLVDREPENVLVLGALGRSLLATVHMEAILLEGAQPLLDQNKLTEAEAIFTKIVDTTEDIAERAEARFNRSRCRTLRQSPDAQADLDAAYADSPDRPEIRYQYCFSLWERGKLNDAIELLESIEEIDREPGWRNVFAAILYDRNEGDDREKCISILEESLANANSLNAAQLFHICEVYCRRLTRIVPSDCVISRLQEHLPEILPQSYRSTLVAHAYLKLDMKESALHHANDAKTSLEVNGSLDEKRLLASIFDDMDKTDVARDILSSSVPLHVLSHDVKWLLSLADQSDDYELIDSICKELHSNQQYDAYCLNVELNALEHFSRFDDALEVIEEAWQFSNNESIHRLLTLRKSIIGVKRRDDSLIEIEPGKLPAVDEVQPSAGQAVTRLLAKGNRQQALLYAYELSRRFPDSSLAANNLVQTHLFAEGGDDTSAVPKHLEVGTGCIAKVLGKTDQIKFICIVSDGTDPINRDRGDI
ncbi:MAG: tetratricopeptide repeat protein, partial [Pseudomonadota bacterium]